MKTRYSIFILMAAAALAGCTKEQDSFDATAAGSIDSEATTLEVGIGIDTKTYLGEKDGEGHHKVFWSNGDQIAVNGTASEELAGLADGTSSAKFTFGSVLSAPYNVVYPASAWKSASQITLPGVQTFKSGGFADGMNPMAGYSADGSGPVSVKHLGAIIKVSILRAAAAADEDNIISVRFKGRNSEQVKGDFNIDFSTGVLTGASDAAEDKEVRVNKSLATSNSEAVVYHLVVPAGTYASGFDVTIQDVNGHIQTKSVTVSTTLEAGHLYNLPEFEFVPTGTELGVVISSAQELIDFATAYNNGEYDALGNSLIATVTADLTFDATSSAAFNATGGIGTSGDVNRFGGTFKGENHTISGLESTVCLFNGTSAGATIKDLTIDNSCSFTFTNPGSGDFEVGPIVGYHRGAIDNVNVAANVALGAASGITYTTSLGGIAGRAVVGSLSDCTFSGAITVPADYVSTYTEGKKTFIGGIVGRVTNADGEVKDCVFSGTIENEGQLVASSEPSELKNNPYLLIGGIAGYNNGTLTGCSTNNHATGVTVTLNDGSDHDYTGTIVTHSTIAYHYAIAGIAGCNNGTVSSCINNANIVNIFSANRGTSGNMNGRYLEIGGIAGYNAKAKEVTGCTNNGTIIDRANPKIHYVGGIVGRNFGIVSSSDNAASATIGVGTSHLSPYGSRMPYVGGIVGSHESGAALSNVHNAADVSVSRIENTTGFTCMIGGIAGYSEESIDGAADGGTITNSGDIAQSSGIGHCATPEGANDYGYHIGGIVGNSTNAVMNVSNSGNVSFKCSATGIGAQYVRLGGIAGKVNAASKVDVDKCINSGNVTFNASATHKANAETRYYYNYLGGIVGYANNVAIKGDSSNKSTNSGIIKGGDGSDNNNQATPSFMVGGIAGYITGDSSIEYCDLIESGNAYNDHWSNRGIGSYDCPAVGGIVGQIVGEDGASIPVSNCNVAATASVNARRGAAGGIAGLAQYATISDCTMPVVFQTSQSGYFYGGIVAAAKNSTVSNCVFSAATIRSSQIQIGGGIVGQLDADSTVDGCSSSATDISKNGTAVTTTGGIAGKSVAGSTIKNSHYTSDIGKICGDANFTDGGGNAADL